MKLTHTSIQALASKLSDQYLKELYEDQRFTELAMSKAEEFMHDVEMDEDLKMDISFMLLESINISKWTPTPWSN